MRGFGIGMRRLIRERGSMLSTIRGNWLLCWRGWGRDVGVGGGDMF